MGRACVPPELRYSDQMDIGDCRLCSSHSQVGIWLWEATIPVRGGGEKTVLWVLSFGIPDVAEFHSRAEKELGAPGTTESALGPKRERGGEKRGCQVVPSGESP